MMRPARMSSKWVKLLPWYYTTRSAPSRASERQRAVEQEFNDSGSNDAASSMPTGSVHLAELVERSGLTLDQVARLIGVSRRSVQGWVVGTPMSGFYEARIYRLRSVVLTAGATPDERRAAMLNSANGGSPFHQLLGELDQGPVLHPSAISARDALGV